MSYTLDCMVFPMLPPVVGPVYGCYVCLRYVQLNRNQVGMAWSHPKRLGFIAVDGPLLKAWRSAEESLKLSSSYASNVCHVRSGVPIARYHLMVPLVCLSSSWNRVALYWRSEMQLQLMIPLACLVICMVL